MTLTPDEARIVLIALDVAAGIGWDGRPAHRELRTAIDKLEEIAGADDTKPNLTIVE